MLEIARGALPSHADQYEELAGWIKQAAPPGPRILDIGSGDGDDLYSARIRGLAGYLVGVDPSPTATAHPNLDEFARCSVEEYASRLQPGDRFDVALAIYVAEHVHDPGAFLAAAHAVLRPGGGLYLLTPNRWHYFGLTASVAALLRVEEPLLSALQRAHGPGHQVPGHGVEHHRLAYRMNSLWSLRHHAEQAGFTRMHVMHLDNPRLFQYCFPGRTAVLPVWYSRAVYSLGLPGLYGTLLCQLTA